MDATLHALGGLLLRALPTFFLVILVHFYLKFVFFRPLEKVLQARYEATQGARELAEDSLKHAEAKAAEYDAALRAARSQLYQELEQLRRDLQQDRDTRVREARARAQAALARVKADLAAEVIELKRALEAETEALSERIADSILKRRAA